MRRTILALKFGRQPRLAAPLGELMAEVAARDPLVAAAQMVVPVPLHASRLRERGFNQADLLARPVARRLDVPLRPDLIRKVRDTPPQSTLQAGGRHTNVAGSFAPSAPLTPISVVLIDDVFSTGTTVSECARVLLTAGASHVSVLTAAAALLVDSPYSCQGRARHGG